MTDLTKKSGEGASTPTLRPAYRNQANTDRQAQTELHLALHTLLENLPTIKKALRAENSRDPQLAHENLSPTDREAMKGVRIAIQVVLANPSATREAVQLRNLRNSQPSHRHPSTIDLQDTRDVRAELQRALNNLSTAMKPTQAGNPHNQPGNTALDRSTQPSDPETRSGPKSTGKLSDLVVEKIVELIADVLKEMADNMAYVIDRSEARLAGNKHQQQPGISNVAGMRSPGAKDANPKQGTSPAGEPWAPTRGAKLQKPPRRK